MKIYGLTSDYFFDSEREGATKDIDEYNTDIKPPIEYENPRFIDGAWLDVPQSEVDTTNQNTREAVNNNIISLQYLASTDWYITRQAETGVEVPSDILTKRAEARASVTEA